MSAQYILSILFFMLVKRPRLRIVAMPACTTHFASSKENAHAPNHGSPCPGSVPWRRTRPGAGRFQAGAWLQKPLQRQGPDRLVSEERQGQGRPYRQDAIAEQKI